MAEGTGLEPYSPCQGLVRGQGGLQDVHACVDLAIHFPVAREAHELLAHPISAPSATHWAGLTRPRGVDLDDRHTGEGGLVLDLAVDFRARPRGQAAVHASGTSARAVECEVLEDDRRLTGLGELHESLRDEMQPLTDAIPLPASFSAQQASHDPTVPRLLRREPPPSPEVGLLDLPDATERHARWDHSFNASHDSVQRIFVRVEGDCRLRLAGFRSILSDDEDNLARDHRKGAETPCRIVQERKMPFGKRQAELDAFRPPDRDAQPSRSPVEAK